MNRMKEITDPTKGLPVPKFHHNSAIKLVYNIIKQHPITANNDMELIVQVWYEEGWNDNKTLRQNLSHVSPASSITKARRDLHRGGYIRYNKSAEEHRYKKFKQIRDELSDQSFLKRLFKR